MESQHATNEPYSTLLFGFFKASDKVIANSSDFANTSTAFKDAFDETRRSASKQSQTSLKTS